MNNAIHITGLDIEITEGLRQHINDRLKKLDHLGDTITKINVTLKVEKLRQIAKASIHVKGMEITASEEGSDMYVAINSMADKLERQIKKHRDQVTDHH